MPTIPHPPDTGASWGAGEEMHERFHPSNLAIGAGLFQDVPEP